MTTTYDISDDIREALQIREDLDGISVDVMVGFFHSVRTKFDIPGSVDGMYIWFIDEWDSVFSAPMGFDTGKFPLFQCALVLGTVGRLYADDAQCLRCFGFCRSRTSPASVRCPSSRIVFLTRLERVIPYTRVHQIWFGHGSICV